MGPGPTILALDVASTTGCAEGRPGEKPRTWKWRLGSDGATRPEKLFKLLSCLSEHLVVSKPKIIVIEAPAMLRGIDTALLLFGAVGVCEAVANGRGVQTIELANVQSVRAFFVDRARFAKVNDGKKAVMERCKALGWEPQGYDEADAAAIWAWACNKWFPKHAQRIEPLFVGSDPR